MTESATAWDHRNSSAKQVTAVGRPLPWPQRSLFWIALALGLAGLPADLFAVEWIGLFLLPGIIFYWLTGWRPDLGDPAIRSTLSLAFVLSLQFGLILLGAGARAPAPRPEVALTLLLLAPLAFAAARARDVDVLLGLFLGLCLLLIGSELSGKQHPWLVGGFLIAACLTLRFESRHRNAPLVAARRFGNLSSTRRSLGHLAIAAAAVCAASGLHTLARSIPTVNQRRQATATNTQVGVDSKFELGGRGSPLQLRDDELVTVSPERRGETLPSGLYLRATYFDVANLHRWDMAKSRGQRLEISKDRWRALDPPKYAGRQPLIGLKVERSSADRGFLWLPPGTRRIKGDVTINWYPSDDHAEERIATGTLQYGVRYRRATAQSGDRAVRTDRQLLQLPRGLPARYRELAEQWTRRSLDEVEIARALIDGLRQRCRYALRDPKGRYQHALDNFLFGEENAGYCMHFASALAILLRCKDVPSRIAVGLHGGEPDPLGGPSRNFGSKHAHAWVEIPIEGLGFMVFDATPPENRESSSARFPDGLDSQDPNAVGADDAERAGTGLLFDSREWLRWLLRALPWMGLLGLLLSTRFWPRRRRNDAEGHGAPPAPLPDALLARRALGEVLRNLNKAGFPRSTGETLEAFAERIRARAEPSTNEEREPTRDRKLAQWREAVAPIERAFGAYQDVRFGHHPFDPERADQITQAQTATRKLR